jgi:hypothetical protein
MSADGHIEGNQSKKSSTGHPGRPNTEERSEFNNGLNAFRLVEENDQIRLALDSTLSPGSRDSLSQTALRSPQGRPEREKTSPSHDSGRWERGTVFETVM